MAFGLLGVLATSSGCEGKVTSGGDSSEGEPRVQLTAGCAVFEGRLKCWGRNDYGRLGLEDTEHRGDQPGEMGDALPEVDLGTGVQVASIATAAWHSCALLTDGGVKCWGRNDGGQLGLGDTEDRGDDPGEMGDALPAVDLGSGRMVSRLFVGAGHSCALFDGGDIKCWGHNTYGQLGLGDGEHRGDDPNEMGDTLAIVDLGAQSRVINLGLGSGRTCALLTDGRVKCWGANTVGQLGLGDTEDRGDEPGEMGDALPSVDLGSSEAVDLIVGAGHACALLATGRVKCWGANDSGQLGLGDRNDRGGSISDMGSALSPVDLGSVEVVGLHGVGNHTCARLSKGRLKCWGTNTFGALGVGDRWGRGYEPGQMGNALPMVDLGRDAVLTSVSPAAHGFTCALLSGRTVKCWGRNAYGQLGLGDTEDRGDEPGEMGDVLPFVDLGF